MGTIVASIGLATAPNPSLGFFNLNYLNKYNTFEHDASLSRVDCYFSGDEGIAKVDNETFNRWFSYFDGLTYIDIDIDIAAKARYAMVHYSRAHMPGSTYQEAHRITSYAETIKFFKTMIDSTGKCREDFLKNSLRYVSTHTLCLRNILSDTDWSTDEERLPFNEGWRPPPKQITDFQIDDFVLRGALATPEKTSWLGEPPQDYFTTHDVPAKCSNSSQRR
ncbi:hypothetical protein BKA63DRAFT_594486 [Paraphoma chrysanthemicola]|nr:hypothetical protein BKA63DRAFT_594486 [Paraphoma chrysanthemicola]